MIDHAQLKVSDLARSMGFYRAALAPLGYAGFGEPPKAELWVAQGSPNRPPLHVAFRTLSRAAVDDFHAAALGAGGRDNGAPGPRRHYHEHYYGAFVLDPDGHNIEVVCHEPVPAPPGRPAAG
jgi:catechol 2,3-dioxygenase-like lactoylglutathione lyase family enzyme